MFSILRTPYSSSPASRRRFRRPRPARRPERRRPVLWVESLEDRTLLSSGPLAVPASPLAPAVPGHFGRQDPQPAAPNAAAVNPVAQNAAATNPAATGTPGTTATAQPVSPSGTTNATAAQQANALALASLGTTPGNPFPTEVLTALQTPTGATTFNPFTGQLMFTSNPAANFLNSVPNPAQLGLLEPPGILAAQVGTTALPTEEGLQAPWLLQQHNLPLTLGGGGGENALLGPKTRDNPRANPGRAALQPNGEQEEPAPASDNGNATPAPVNQPARPAQPNAGPAPMTDGDEQPAQVANPAAAGKLPGWEILRETETPAQVVLPVEQAPVVQAATAPATPAPFWVRVVSALSFAAGAVGAVWFPKFGVAGLSREDLLSLRRGTRGRSPRS